MTALISFDDTKAIWSYKVGYFEVLLYHSVIQNSSREALPNLYPDVEREIAVILHEMKPEVYPEPVGSLGFLEFTDYPLEEQKEFLAAMKLGVEEIRAMPRNGRYAWRFEAKDTFVELGQELIKLMEESLAASQAKARRQSNKNS